MSKYESFDNDSRKGGIKLCKFLSARKKSDEDRRYEISKMTMPFSTTSPYHNIYDFNKKTKVVCQNTDLTMFLDQCKAVFVGDAGSGKTSLIQQFTSAHFDLDYKPTAAAEYETKYFDILGIEYIVGFWDLPGEERFKFISQSYYKNANVIVVTFDLTRPMTLVNATKWMREALSANIKTDPIRFLVGTRSDLLNKKTLEGIEMHANFIAQELDAEYISVSSKDGSGVNDLFRRFTALAFENSVQKLIRPPDYHTVKNNLSSEFTSMTIANCRRVVRKLRALRFIKLPGL